MKTVLTKRTAKLAIVAKLSDDRLKLFLDAEPGGPEPVSRGDILTILAELGDTSEMDVGVIDDIAIHLSRGEAVKERRIRKGAPSEDGADGKIVFMVKKFTGKGDLKGDAEEKVKLSDIHLFDNVTKGQAVARIYAPRSGTPGRDALGKEISPRAGKPFKLVIDKTLSIRRSDDPRHHYEELVAEEDGYLREEKGKLGIQHQLVVSEDLDYRYGNIEFVGSVVVKGDVLPGFSLVAKREIRVMGSLMGGSLVSTEGDIVLDRGAFGGRTSKLSAGGDLTALSLHEVEAEARGKIYVKRDATDCVLRTPGTVSIPDGRLIGGESYVVCGLEAKQIGNEAGAPTTIHLCNTVEATAEYGTLLVNIASHEKAIHLLELHLGPLAVSDARLSLLNEPHRSKMAALIEKLRHVKDSRARLVNKKNRMLESARVNETARVSFSDKLHFGVAVIAGDDSYVIKDDLSGPASLEYVAADRKFALGEQRNIQCTFSEPEGE